MSRTAEERRREQERDLTPPERPNRPIQGRVLTPMEEVDERNKAGAAKAKAHRIVQEEMLRKAPKKYTPEW